MKVRLLGPLSAEAGGVELALGGLKQRSVFALLAIHAGRVVPLDRIADQLWSDEPPSRATMALQSYISRLRRVLAEAGAGGADVPQIVTRPPGWMLTLDPGEVDASRFVSMVDQGRLLLLEGTREGAARAKSELETALGLWVGDPLGDLDSVGFAHEEAGRLGEVRLAAIELLLEARLAEGESGSVVEQARGFVTENPFRERGWCSLMLALYRSGRQAEAVAAAAQLRRSLADELGLDPSPEARELEQLILRQDPSLAGVTSPPRRLPSVAPAQVALSAPADPDGRQLLVGRADVLASVDDAVRAAVDGQGQLLVLEASAGLGKSAVLDVLGERFRSAGGTVLTGAGLGAGATPALWPWLTIVRELVASLPSEPTASAEGMRRMADAILTPAPPGVSSGSGAVDADLARTRLFRSVIELLAQARSEGPLAVVLDDVHWVDADTMNLLALAVDELTDSGVLFAVAARSDDPGAVAVLELTGRARRHRVERLQLRELDADEVAELVRELSGEEADPAVVAAIVDRTMGNPLFASELIRLLSSERRINAAEVYVALPAEVRDVLRRRIERLPEQTVALLTVTAIIGGSADIDTLAHVSGLTPDAVLDACESALLVGLLREDKSGSDIRFMLSHDMVRQTLDESLTSARRLRLHASVAQALMVRPATTPQQTLELARHLTAAAPVVGPQAAIPYLVQASEDAIARFATDQAEQHLRTALDLVGRVTDPGKRAGLEGPVRARLTLLPFGASGFSSVLAHSPKTEEPGVSHGGHPGREVAPPTDAETTAAWLGVTILAIISGEHVWGMEAAARALQQSLPPMGSAAAHFILGFGAFLLGDTQAAARHFHLVETDLSHEEEDVDVAGIFAIPVATSAQLALIAHVGGDESGADAHLSLAAARAGSSPLNLVVVEQAHCWLAAMRGDLDSAQRHVKGCLQLAGEFDFPLYLVRAQFLAGWVDALRGDRSGVANMDAAYAAYASSGVRIFIPFYLLLRAEAHAAIGDLGEAQTLVVEARVMSSQLRDVCRSPRLLALAETLVPA